MRSGGFHLSFGEAKFQSQFPAYPSIHLSCDSMALAGRVCLFRSSFWKDAPNVVKALHAAAIVSIIIDIVIPITAIYTHIKGHFPRGHPDIGTFSTDYTVLYVMQC